MSQQGDLESRIAAYLAGGWGQRPRTSEEPGERGWYALRTEPQRELAVAAGLAERGLTFFLPMQTDHCGSPPVLHMEPLFPGYVFVMCEPEDFANLIGLDGVINFVRYIREGGVAWPVEFPGRIILGLQIEERAGTYDMTRTVRAPKYHPRKGETVRITAGPYFDFVATVLRTPRNDRCKLLIQHESFAAPRERTEDVAHLTAA